MHACELLANSSTSDIKLGLTIRRLLPAALSFPSSPHAQDVWDQEMADSVVIILTLLFCFSISTLDRILMLLLALELVV